MNYKKANEYANWILIGAMASCGGCFFAKGWIALALIGLAIVLIGISIFLRVKYSRCPYCKKRLHLGFRMEPNKCPYCRELLIKPEDEK